MFTKDRTAAPLRLVAPAPTDSRQADADLVQALRGGLPWAPEAIWDRHSDNVSRFLVRSLGCPPDQVEDLTQEVFLRVFSKPSAIREPAALREFVMGVAVRVLKNELRYRWIRRKVRLSNDGELPEVPATGGSDQSARHALRRCYAILDRLTARERAAFVLRYLEEMTVSEVADRLDVSRSTAKRLISSGVSKVSQHVGRDTDLKTYFLGGGGSFHGR